MRKTRWLIVLAIAVILVGIRIAGERAFPYTPEPGLSKQTAASDTSLYQSSHQILTTDNPDGHTSLVVGLGSPRGALAARLALAQKAEKSLYVQYYLFHDDTVGQALLKAMVDAADRGVKVRLLLDDMAVYGHDKLFAALDKAVPNLDIKVFNPTWLRHARVLEFAARFPRSSRRMHNKSFTADNALTVVGGRNIGNEYFDINTDIVFADYDVLAGGDVAPAVADEFQLYWNSSLAIDIEQLATADMGSRFQQWLEDLESSSKHWKNILEDNFDKDILRAGLDNRRLFKGSAYVINDPPGKVATSLFSRGEYMAKDILAIMNEASSELLISSPYFIPGDNGVDLFRQLVARGVKVTILTNSFAANDVGAVHAGYVDYRKQLVEAGVELYEIKPEKEKNFRLLGATDVGLHAKTFILDKSRAYVGSFNLDPRSALHNTEMGIVIDSPEYAGWQAENLSGYIERNSWRIAIEQGKVVWKDENETLTTEPNMSAMQRGLVWVLSWLPVEWLL